MFLMSLCHSLTTHLVLKITMIKKIITVLMRLLLVWMEKSLCLMYIECGNNKRRHRIINKQKLLSFLVGKKSEKTTKIQQFF